MPDVFFYRNDQPGAPVLNDSLGSLNALLYACLVTGFGSTGLVSITRSGSVATGSTASAHNFVVGDSILVAGATQPEYNGKFTVTAVAGNTLSWAVTGTPTTPATGTFTVKVAPVGWERPYTSGNVSVFRSADVASSRRYFRINDGLANDGTGYRGAECKLYETMTAVSTGTLKATRTWIKSLIGTTAQKWALVCSARTVYLFSSIYDLTGHAESDDLYPFAAFGDLNSFKPGDSYSAFAIESRTNFSNLFDVYVSEAAATCSVCRSYTGLGTVVDAYGLGPDLRSMGVVPGGLNPVDSAVPLVFPRLVLEAHAAYGRVLRGTVPGVGTSLSPIASEIRAGTPNASGFWQRFSGVSIGGTSRDVVLFAFSRNGNRFGVPVDLTGPWH